MRIYQPVRGVGGALRENSFVMIDDAGVEIGQGGLEYRVIKKMLPDRPLDIEMTMNAHALRRAERQSRAHQGRRGRSARAAVYPLRD